MKQLECIKCGKVQNYINRESVGVTRESVIKEKLWKEIDGILYCAKCEPEIKPEAIEEKIVEKVKKRVKKEVKEEIKAEIKEEAKVDIEPKEEKKAKQPDRKKPFFGGKDEKENS